MIRRFRWWLSEKLQWLAYSIEPELDMSGPSLGELIADHIMSNPDKTIEQMREHNALFRRLTE